MLQGPEWRDIDASKDMASLLLVRSTVLSLLERARGAKSDSVLCSKFLDLICFTRQLNSSLGAEVDIIVSDDSVGNPFVDVLRREGIFYFPSFLEDLTDKEYRDLLENVIYRIGCDCDR